MYIRSVFVFTDFRFVWVSIFIFSFNHLAFNIDIYTLIGKVFLIQESGLINIVFFFVKVLDFYIIYLFTYILL